MNEMTPRQIVELVDACGMRACSSEQHHGCPFGDDSLIDCEERLMALYDETIKKLLDFWEAGHGTEHI